MGKKIYKHIYPLPALACFDLLIEAGQQLPEATEAPGGILTGRWESTLVDRQKGVLEWKLYDFNVTTSTIQVSLQAVSATDTYVIYEVHRTGQLFDVFKQYDQTLDQLLEPFNELLKQALKQEANPDEESPGEVLDE